MVPIFVISLPDCHDRRARVSASMAALALPFEFFDGVDGRKRTLDDFSDDEYAREARIENDGYDLAPTEIACCLSHAAALLEAKKRNYKNVVIFEDDVEVGRDFLEILSFIERSQKKYPIVRLSGLKKRRMINKESINTHYDIGVLTGPTSGLAAMFYHASIYDEILGRLKPVRTQCDVAVDRYWDRGAPLHRVAPYPVTLQNVVSVIDAKSTAPIDAWRAPDDYARSVRKKLRRRRRRDIVKRARMTAMLVLGGWLRRVSSRSRSRP